MSSNANKFGTGGCYACQNCGRQTRSTGMENENNGTCYECHEYCGIQNSINDEGATPEKIASLDFWIGTITEKGGILKGINDGPFQVRSAGWAFEDLSFAKLRGMK